MRVYSYYVEKVMTNSAEHENGIISKTEQLLLVVLLLLLLLLLSLSLYYDYFFHHTAIQNPDWFYLSGTGLPG